LASAVVVVAGNQVLARSPTLVAARATNNKGEEGGEGGEEKNEREKMREKNEEPILQRPRPRPPFALALALSLAFFLHHVFWYGGLPLVVTFPLLYFSFSFSFFLSCGRSSSWCIGPNGGAEQ
jgi:hypothetical protein